MAGEQRPALILMDIQLPGIGVGLFFAKISSDSLRSSEIRQSVHRPKAPDSRWRTGSEQAELDLWRVFGPARGPADVAMMQAHRLRESG